MRAAAGVLGDRAFRLLWCSLTASVAADYIFPIAVVISLVRGGYGAAAIGLVLAGRLIALVGFALFGGVWADRLPRRLVMACSQLGLVAITLVVAIWPLAPFLGAAVFLGGLCEAFFRPALQGVLSTVLPERHRRTGIAMTSVSLRAGSLLGAFAGSAIVVAFGPWAAFLAAALGFGISAGLIWLMREPMLPTVPRRPLMAEIRQGVREVLSRPWMAAVIAVLALHQTLIVAPAQVLLPATALKLQWNFLPLHEGDAIYGLSLAALSLGGLIGAGLAMLRPGPRPGLTAMLGLLPYGLVPLSLMTSTTPWPVFTCFLLAGIGLEVAAIEWVIGMLREVPPGRQSRVASLEWVAVLGLTPFGLVTTGVLVDTVGARPVLLVSALAAVLPLVALVVPGLVELRSRSWSDESS
ncbi:MFS transporter [Nonomuraea typhae]|uniref:MFS transporter n=1 Tax=Nonomuraea typhae TaxID=2603600 RepID=UPI0012F8E080|nr:MFS transporter [Nonomuraea typhae]